jgi:hypothetical protein
LRTPAASSRAPLRPMWRPSAQRRGPHRPRRDLRPIPRRADGLGGRVALRGGRDSNASRKCPQNIGNYAGSCARGASSIAPTRDRSRPLATSRDQSMDDIRVRTRSRPGRRCDRRPLGDCGGPCSRGDAKAQERRPGRRLILKAAVRYGRPANPREQGKLRPRPSRSSLA